MTFQEEHDLASEYFSSMDSSLCFDPLVGTERVWYFVSFKRDDVNLNGDKGGEGGWFFRNQRTKPKVNGTF